MDHFNLDNWPIVFFKTQNNFSMDDDNFDNFKISYLNLLKKCKNNKEKMVLICDLNELNTNNTNMKYIMNFAKFNKEIYKFNKEYVQGVCLMSSNKYLKDLVNIYLTFCKPACLFKICKNTNKANKFLKEKCNVQFDTNIIFNNNIVYNIEEIVEEEEEEIKIIEENDDNDNDSNESLSNKYSELYP